MILHDQHVHSKYSADSNEELKLYFEKAVELGCKYFVTTDHFDLDLVEHHEDWTVDFDAFKKEIKSLTQIYTSITPLLGIEVGYRTDKLDEIISQIKSEDFDLVNLSIHDIPDADFYWIKYFNKFGINNLMNKYFDAMIEATKNFDNFDVLSHIDYAFKTIYLEDYSYDISIFEEKIKQVMINLINKNKALEINTKVQEAINKDSHTKYLLNLYKSLGGRYLTLSSDAHSVKRYKSSFDKYTKMIKECGFDHLVYFVKRKMYIYNI